MDGLSIPQRIVLTGFAQEKVRKMTYRQLMEVLHLSSGLGITLEGLHERGRVHYNLGEAGHFTGDTLISLCSVIELPYDYKLVVLAPDENEAPHPQPMWQVLVSNTPDPRDESEGYHFVADQPFDELAEAIRQQLLRDCISDSILREVWTTSVVPELERIYREYTQRSTNPQFREV